MEQDLFEAFRRWPIATEEERAVFQRRWPGVFGVGPGGNPGGGIRINVTTFSTFTDNHHIYSDPFASLYGDLFGPPVKGDRRRAEKIAAIQRLADDERAPEGEREAARAALKRMGA